MCSLNFIHYKFLARVCFAGFFFASTLTPLTAAPGALKQIPLKVSARDRTAKAEVPPGVQEVTLQRFANPGGWQKVATRAAIGGKVEFRLPKAAKNARWRAVGREQAIAKEEVISELEENDEQQVEQPSKRKFPPNFYQGENNFSTKLAVQLEQVVDISSFNGSEITSIGSVTPGVTISSFGLTTANSRTTESLASAVEEADIWRTEGSIVYFFNQLRGLQVLDLSNAADPRLLATLRLPAVGENLYLLPSSGESRSLVLLTKVPRSETPTTRIHLVKVTGSVVEVTHTQDVAGTLADSRMVGDRLVLVTLPSPSLPLWTIPTIDKKAVVSQWKITPDQAPVAAGQVEIAGYSPVITAGADWLAVAMRTAASWGSSDVTVFALGGSDLVNLTPSPVQTAGVVLDKFKIHWSGDVLTTISEQIVRNSIWRGPITVLENFQVPKTPLTGEAPRLGSLELAPGERLYATRFAKDKAYIVTFRQIDPLWVVDLRDAANPKVAGHLEVPGWSTYLEPVGDDLLFSVGWESNSVAASLFDVADPAMPKLLRRINLNGGWSSEVLRNEQALKLIPEAGLVMIPTATYDSATHTYQSAVQLLDLDLKGRDLIQRGVIDHEFEARRSQVIGENVVSISQKALVAAGISNRDLPNILSEVSLAWPVNRVLDVADYMVHIESGGGAFSRPTLRLSPENDTEAIIKEMDLGDGVVKTADVRSGMLYVVRELTGEKRMLHLDVYDLSNIPAVTRLGTCAVEIEWGQTISEDRLLWPRSNRPSMVLRSQSSWPIWNYSPRVFAPRMASVATLPVIDSQALGGTGIISITGISSWCLPWYGSQKSKLLVFDTTDPTAPSAGQPIQIGTEHTISNNVHQAADGLVVIGAEERGNSKNLQTVYVVEVAATGEPVKRPGIDLPGALFAVTELDRDGFLAFTRGVDAEGDPALQVSASDGFDAYEITKLEIEKTGAETAGQRRVFLAADEGVQRYRLSDEGKFVSEETLALGWKPTEFAWKNGVAWRNGVLLGRDTKSLFAAEPKASSVSQWPAPTMGYPFQNINVALDGDILIPLGEYGADRFRR